MYSGRLLFVDTWATFVHRQDLSLKPLKMGCIQQALELDQFTVHSQTTLTSGRVVSSWGQTTRLQWQKSFVERDVMFGLCAHVQSTSGESACHGVVCVPSFWYRHCQTFIDWSMCTRSLSPWPVAKGWSLGRKNFHHPQKIQNQHFSVECILACLAPLKISRYESCFASSVPCPATGLSVPLPLHCCHEKRNDSEKGLHK